MSYAVPHRFSHGDEPTAAQMNTYTDALNAIYARMGDVQYHYPAAHVLPGEDYDSHYKVHLHRWGWFEGAGEIVDPAGDGDSVTLSDDGGPTRVDLRSVTWLFIGKLYQITGCTWYMEASDAIAPQFNYFLRLENGDYWLLEGGGRILTERG